MILPTLGKKRLTSGKALEYLFPLLFILHLSSDTFEEADPLVSDASWGGMHFLVHVQFAVLPM